MEFTWVDFFELIDRMWALKQSEIGRCLHRHRSTISNLANGKQKNFKKTSNEIYLELFDPTEGKLSHIYGMDEKSLLKELLQEIDDMGLTKAIENIDSNNYKTFVLGLVDLAKESEPSKKSNKKGSVTTSKSNPKVKAPSKEESKPIRLSDTYDEYFEGYGISNFIDHSPASLTPDRIRDTIHFLGSVGYGDKFKNAENREPKIYLDKDEDVFQYINKFSDKLFEYISCLKKYSIGSPDQFPEHYKPPEDDIQDFITETDRYREELKSLSQLIEVKIDNYERYQLRKAHKIWGENSQSDVF